MGLRAEAERTGVPATTLAREAVVWWLRQQGRKARHDAIAAYAAEMAGTRLDLDAELESAAIDHILNRSLSSLYATGIGQSTANPAGRSTREADDDPRWRL